MIEQGPLLERLLAGDFICQISEPDLYRRISDDNLQHAINQYLRPLNRRLASNDEGSVYFLAYQDLTSSARDHLGKQFAETMQSLLPVLEWLQLVQEALGRDVALSAGDTLKLQEFIGRSEDNQSLRQRVHNLATDRFFNSKSDVLDQQIKLIFTRLKEHGYLLQPHTARNYYRVTGKIDYLLDVVRFIRDEEQLPVADTPTQEELL